MRCPVPGHGRTVIAEGVPGVSRQWCASRVRWPSLRLRLCVDFLTACCGRELAHADQTGSIPVPALRPAPPVSWLWLILSSVFFAGGYWGGLGCSLLQRGASSLSRCGGRRWGVPLVGWCLLGFGRAALYLGQHRVADGWDEARQDDLMSQTRQGRRFSAITGCEFVHRASSSRGAANRPTRGFAGWKRFA